MEFANNEVYTLVRVPLGHPKMARTQKKSEKLTSLSGNRNKSKVLILNESL